MARAGDPASVEAPPAIRTKTTDSDGGGTNMNWMDNSRMKRGVIRRSAAVLAVAFLFLLAPPGCDGGQIDFGPLLDAVGQGIVDSITKLVEARFLIWVL